MPAFRGNAPHRLAAWTCTALLLMSGAPGLSHAASPGDAVAVLSGKVTRVIDGDTIDVLLSSGVIRVRLHGVDAPERDQAGGAAATAWLTQQLHDQQALLEPVSQDQYDRLVAVVLLQERNINRELVQAGHAWAYRRYMRRGEVALCSLEEQARSMSLGLWAAVAHAPWEHRATNGKGPFTSYGTHTARDCALSVGRRRP